MKRGDWHRTKDLVLKGTDWIVNEMKRREAYAAGLLEKNACGSGYDFDVYIHFGAGTGWLWMIMERMKVGNAKLEEIDMLQEVTKQIEGHTICALGDAAAWPVQGLIRHFRPELERRIRERAERELLQAAA
ncbi:hypothetical protein Bca4012_047576 [Brassica carinata]